MQRYQDIALATIGGTTLPLNGASVVVYATGLTTPVTIYSDNASTPTARANPLTAGTDGRFFFYAPSGRYDIVVSKPGYSSYTLTDVLFYEPRETSGSNVIPSATALVLLPDRDTMQVSGTTAITSISTATKGRTIVLTFQGVLTLTDGGNLKLAGNYVTTADDSIMLTCQDGTNWFEVGRAAA